MSRRVRQKTASQEDPDDRLEKALIFVAGTMDRLRDKGLVEGGLRLSEDGRRRFEALKREGFEPTDEEFRVALAGLVEGAEELDGRPCDGPPQDG